MTRRKAARRQQARADHRQCPKCKSKRAIPILYGMPPPELERDEREGKLVLGGCTPDESKTWHCKNCGHDWGDRRRD